MRVVTEQVTQRGCGVSVLGDTEILTGHSPDQTALAEPELAMSRMLDQTITRGNVLSQ